MIQRLRETLTHNLGIKISSVVLALFIYAYVYSKEEQETILQVPMALAGLPEHLTYQGDVPDRVRVRVRARGVELWRLRAQPPQAVIELREAEPGQLLRPVTTSDVRLPSGVVAQVRQIVDQPDLRLQIERMVSRRVPVQPVLTGRPGAGATRYGDLEVDPDSVSIEGAESLVEPVKELRTEEINLDGRSTSLEEWVRVKGPDGLSLSTEEVWVRVPVERLVERTMGPVEVRLPPALSLTWTTQPESVDVQMRGPASLLDDVVPGGLEVRAVPQQPIEGEQSDVPLQLKFDAGIDPQLSVIGFVPEAVALIRRAR